MQLRNRADPTNVKISSRPKTYLEPSPKSMIEYFVKIVKSKKLSTSFAKTRHHGCSTGFYLHFWTL